MKNDTYWYGNWRLVQKLLTAILVHILTPASCTQACQQEDMILGYLNPFQGWNVEDITFSTEC